MKILIACEESQEVCKAFRARGHEAYSCDILPCSGGHPEWHLQGDVLPLLTEKWDMIIAFPPCTYLTSTANSWLKDQLARKSGALVGDERRKARDKAIKFFLTFANTTCTKVSIENPIGCMSRIWRKPDQIIQPYMFGHPERKSTCIWLRGLPKLVPTQIVEPISYLSGGKKYSETHYKTFFRHGRTLNRLDCLQQNAERSKLRSKTYPGIATAMAEQWGDNR